MEKTKFDNVFKLVMELAKRGVSVDYAIIDQEAQGIKCYSSLKTYSISVREKESYGNPIKLASFNSLMRGMLWGLMTALDYLEQTEEKDLNISLNELREIPLYKVADLAKKGAAIDYTIAYNEEQELAYSITVAKTWSFGKIITRELFDNLDEDMKNGIKLAEAYLKGDVCGQ